MQFSRSRELSRRLRASVPGGCHTYAKGEEQYPESTPCVIARGEGCRVWDVDGNEYLEYGMGLRAVTLGHAYAPVVEAVRASLALGTNFTRPAAIELACAELFLSLIDRAEMVKLTKDGSSAVSGAVKLARAYTGRLKLAICGDQPFFSYDDWFMATTTLDGGIPAAAREETVRFPYGDAESLEQLLQAHAIAAVIMEPARTTEPPPGYLQRVRALCSRHGAVLVFDEMITGFRWHTRGAQHAYDVTPDLSTFGKALANGFSLSALAGKRSLMELGARDVFLLSSTHGAETPSLAAAIRTMEIYRDEPVVEHLHRQGARLRRGLEQAAQHHGVQHHFELLGRDCNLVFGTRDADGAPSQALRTLLLQETQRRGVLMPSLVVSYSHRDEDIDRTVEVVDQALAIYARALHDGVDGLLEGRPSRVVYTRR